MGDKVKRLRPEERIKKRNQKKREREAGKGQSRSKARKIDTAVNVLNADVDAVYRPQTRDTKQAYEALLSLIQHAMGDKPHDVLQSAADEVLAIMKEDNVKLKVQKQELKKLLGISHKFDDERFGRFINVTKKITDYSAQLETREEKVEDKAGADDEIEVPVIFDASDEEDDSGLDEVKEEDMQEEGVEADRTFKISSKVFQEEKKREDEKMKELQVRSIDAFWLQRQLSEYYKDAHTSVQMAEKVFSILSNPSNDDVACENLLVEELDYDKFSFIRKLRRNRLKIVYCMKLARAKGKEREEIETEMANDAKLAPILQALKKTSTAADRNTERERKQMKEANARMEEDEANADSNDTFWNKKPKAMLDLDSLAFQQGARLMSTKECKLPKNSEIINKKGYQEVHIPCLKEKPFKRSEKLVPFTDLPEWARLPFKGMKTLNRIQSRVYPVAFKSAHNMLICAPTGAGKTNCALLSILRVIGTHMNPDGTINLNSFKIIYVAPMKSLAQEMVLNFGKRLKDYGIKVAELTGDSQLTKQQIDATQILVVTPEKWDIVTRKNGERTYTQLVKLVIIDEIHLLHDSRGPVLESIVARSIRQTESTQQLIRIVGLSATLPNYKDVAMFLRVKLDKGLFFFDNSYRPCPLAQQYIGITAKKAFKRYQMMNEICYDKVMQNAGKNQVLVFVHSRKETVTTSRFLRDTALENEELNKFLADDSGHRAVLQTEAESVKNEALQDLLPYGFAIHHAGMKREDRELVEELFADRHIQVLVCTATLAWGVNLPAHTVIIKGTQIYSPEAGTWVELSPLDIMQMMGRAGRPQFDKFGEGILITSHSELHYYLSLLNEQLPIESQYIKKLADNMNAEISMGTVQNVEEAVQWLGYTYLYVRMLRSPHLYGVDPSSIESDSTLEQRRVDLIHSAATTLEKHNMIKYNRQTGSFQITDLGIVSSHYYITHQSMAVFNEYLKPHMSDIELFRVFSLSSEFQYITVRSEEKLELARLLDKVPIPVKEGIDEPSAKVNVLLQAYISRLPLEGYALMADMVYITQSAGRVMRAMFEIVLKRGWAAAAVKTLNLCNMISHRMWAAQSPLRQFKGIPPGIIKRIEGKEFSWDRLYDLQAHAIGELVRFPSMGKRIHRCVHQLPRVELMAHVQPITRTVLRVELTISPDFAFDQKLHGFAEPFWIIVEDVDGETILHHEYFILKKQFAKEQHSVNFTIPIYEPMPPQYFIRVISNRWLGAATVLPVSFRHLLLPERYAAPTELLDLQPLSISELQNEKFIKLYSGKFETFNPIQTQVFNSVYKNDNNILITAPTGSGKTVCAELAIFRMLSQLASGRRKMSGRCVYIAPLEELADERLADWSEKFGRLGLKVVKLTGGQEDLRTMKTGQIVISTPKAWDIMSRRWKTRKDVQTVSLFIVDEIHLIGGDVGPVLEVIVSRMRYIAAQTENKIRIVALGTSVANAKDLGDWIGASSSYCFNFHPNVRPVPLEIRVQGFGINHYPSRMLAMSKPTYMSIKRLSAGKPVIIFVSSRKQAARASVEMITYAAAEEDPKKFLHADQKDIKEYLAEIENETLKETLANGVGFLHTGLSDKEKRIVHELYKAEAIQVVVVEHKLCWGLTLTAHLVILMGTQSYDGSEHRYVDYPITSVVQMMGRACRPLKDTNGKCTIYCYTPKKEFYKKFLYEPFPVESHLDHMLHNHLNAEIVTRRIETFQDAVDYLTWTFMYRRLTQNPNYYNLQGISHRHLSDHLSELVESTLNDLETSKCISVDEMDLSPLNLGMIASYYYINYTTVELFNSSLSKGTKMKGLLEILSHANEFEMIPLRQGEDRALQKLSRRMPLKVSSEEEFHSPHVKAHLLLQSHFARQLLSPTVQGDRDELLPVALRLLQAIVDVISSAGWLETALAAMELSQMIVQGMWSTDPIVLQIPHMSKELAKKCVSKGIKNVFDILDMEDDDRVKLLGMPAAKLDDVATFCNTYPNIEVKYEILEADEITAGSRVVVQVNLERDADDEEDEEEDQKSYVVEPVYSKRYPVAKQEAWWLVIGDQKKNKLLSIKRVVMRKKVHTLRLDFIAPSEGDYTFKLFFMCDSYLGCDQEFSFKIKVEEGDDDDEDEDEDDMSEDK
uniref:RNA helicase n=1 Tax=Amorphochlora amoebiformis TaxID=1561963 RepID=A0A7S0D2D4_9EUKA